MMSIRNYSRQIAYWRKVALRNIRATLAVVFFAAALTGLTACTENAPQPKSRTTAPTVGGIRGPVSGATSTTDDTQCTIFAGTTRDYQLCQQCKITLCGSSSCTANQNQLVACVHTNITSSGQSCSIPQCSETQVPDFASCSCRDIQAAGSIGAQPGQADQTTPVLRIGATVVNKVCLPGRSNPTDPTEDHRYDCIISSTVSTANQSPQYTSAPPDNVFVDNDYIRWDLSLDASQYSPATPLAFNRPFNGSWSTLFFNYDFQYELKPNTELASSMYNATTQSLQITFNDCPENFSGFVGTLTGDLPCSNITPGATANGRALLALSKNGRTGRAKLELLSTNGDYSNTKLSDTGTVGNPTPKISSTAVDGQYGVGKASVTSLNGGAFADNTHSTGLIGNLGSYKFTFGDISVEREGTTTIVGTTNATHRKSINVGLGFVPVSVVESSALSPQGLRGSVTNRDCSHADATLETCVVTAVHRTSGGAIAVQNFSPLFESNADASLVGSLPSGITAAGTPKIIEDTSQIALSDTTTPARLRVFTRATDGNIYMVRYERGSWRNWMSLGRPWVCNGNTAGCSDLTTSLARPLRPFLPSNTDLAAAAQTTSQNDGISIAGEPFVVSKMINGGQSVIAIFVRVSQIKADATGSDTGKLGPLHNTVFYTMSTTPLAPTTVTQNLLHDQVNNWTPWSPIYNGTTPFRTLGNPVVVIRPSSFPATASANPLGFFLVLGVTNLSPLALSGGGSTTHHPPIRNVADGGSFPANPDALSGTGDLPLRWFNYGRNLSYAHVLVPSNSATATDYSPFTAVGVEDNMFNGSRGVTVSDLSALLNSTTLTTRVYASAIFSRNCAFEGYSTALGAGAANGLTTPCHFQKALIANEISFGGEVVAPPSLGVPTFGKAAYTRTTTDATSGHGTPFLGKPGVIDISSLTPTQREYALPINSGSTRDISNAAHKANRNHLIFSRSLCPKSGTSAACDYGRPTIALTGTDNSSIVGGAFDAFNERGTFFTYHYSKSFDSSMGDSGFAGGTNRMIQAIYPTSDIVPIFSQMKKKAGFDVPVYYFFRDASGRLAHGWFESRSAATVGRKFWSAVTRGAFVN